MGEEKLSDPDKLVAALAAGRGSMTHQLLDQADSALDRLVARHRTGQMTDREAAVGVALISELRSAADKAHRDIIKGTEAGEQITTNRSSR